MHWIIAPVILPALVAPIIAFVMRHDIVLARTASIATTAAVLVISLGLLVTVGDGDVHVYRLGDWPAPFGIVLVLDRLSALLVAMTSILGLIVLLHVVATDWDRRGRHFHALFQFQLMGISGAFLTGDAFNLFVFFEILLIASYGLMIHGGGKARMKAGLQYVVMNLAGSTLFLFALGTLYAVTGTLNIADLAEKVREIPADEAALIRVAAILLMMVFAIKAALFPVQFWLPATYSNAPAPVAALFAIMTKVGAYAILRIYTVVFGPDVAATGGLAETWLFAGAVVTIAVGTIGTLGATRLLPMISYAVVGSMGVLMLAVSAFTPEAGLAALYYLVHSTFAAAALFLLADLVVARRGQSDALRPAAIGSQTGLFAALFFAAAIAMAGMPPLSGFLGKLLVLDAMREGVHAPTAWVAILVGSLLTIVAFARAGSALFWKPAEGEAAPGPGPAGPLALAPVASSIGLLAALTIWAGPASRFLEATAQDLFDRSAYVTAVLGPSPEDTGEITATPSTDTEEES